MSGNGNKRALANPAATGAIVKKMKEDFAEEIKKIVKEAEDKKARDARQYERVIRADQAEINGLRLQLVLCEDTIRLRNATIARLQHQITRLQGQKERAITRNFSANNAVGTLEARINILEVEKELLLNEIGLLTTQKERIRATLQGLNAAHELLFETNQQLLAHVQDLTTNHQQLQKDHDAVVIKQLETTLHNQTLVNAFQGLPRELREQCVKFWAQKNTNPNVEEVQEEVQEEDAVNETINIEEME